MEAALGECMRIARDEIEFSFFRSSGPGGQKKNTTDSAVRLRHLPTGIVVVATASRSQYKNKQLALEELEQRLLRLSRKPKRRHATKPTRASRQRRLESKHRRARVKHLRRAPRGDE